MLTTYIQVQVDMPVDLAHAKAAAQERRAVGACGMKESQHSQPFLVAVAFTNRLSIAANTKQTPGDSAHETTLTTVGLVTPRDAKPNLG